MVAERLSRTSEMRNQSVFILWQRASVWSAKVLFRFYHELRKCETKASISGGFAKRLECESPLSLLSRTSEMRNQSLYILWLREAFGSRESPLSLLSRTSEMRNQSLYILWLREAFGVRKSSFAFITNSEMKPKLVYPVHSQALEVRKSSFAFVTNFGNAKPKLAYPVARERFRP